MKHGCAIVLSAFAIIALGGCAGAPPKTPRSAPASGAREEAIRFLEHRTKEIDTVHSVVELRWTSPDLQTPFSCRANLVFQTPDRLRLRGTSKAFFTIFDLVVDLEEIRIDIPRKKVLIRGTRSDPEWSRFAIDPDLVAVALLAHPVPEAEKIEICEQGANFIWKGDRTWMEIDGGIGRPTHFHREEPLTDIVWDEWDEVEGVAWPRHVKLIWPEEGGRLEIDFARVQLGRPIREGYFSEKPEDDREVLTPSKGIERWADFLEKEFEDNGQE